MGLLSQDMAARMRKGGAAPVDPRQDMAARMRKGGAAPVGPRQDMAARMRKGGAAPVDVGAIRTFKLARDQKKVSLEPLWRR